MVPLGDKNQYTGNGTTAVYVYGFRIFDKTHLKVTKLVSGASAETPLTVDVDYSVQDVGDDEGTITLLAGNLPNGDKLTVRRFLPLTQDSVFTNQGAYNAESHQNEFDRGVMVAQQQQSELDRCLKIAETDTVSAAAVILPPVSQRAGKYLKFDGSGNLSVATSVDPGLVDFSPFGEDFVDSADAQTARTLLGFNVAGGKVPQSLIGDDAVGAAQLADNAVVTANIVDLNVTTAKIANDAVDATKLKDDAVTDANRAVTTNHIRDLNVTTAKINDLAVTSGKIAAGAVGTTQLADGSVTSAKLAASITPAAATVSFDKLKVTTLFDADVTVGAATVAVELIGVPTFGNQNVPIIFSVNPVSGNVTATAALRVSTNGDGNVDILFTRTSGTTGVFRLKAYQLSLT